MGVDTACPAIIGAHVSEVWDQQPETLINNSCVDYDWWLVASDQSISLVNQLKQGSFIDFMVIIWLQSRCLTGHMETIVQLLDNDNEET